MGRKLVPDCNNQKIIIGGKGKKFKYAYHKFILNARTPIKKVESS